MSRKRSLYPQRRERLKKLLDEFAAAHGHCPSISEIHEQTGWGRAVIRGYLTCLILEGETLPPKYKRRNADRFTSRQEDLLSFLRQYHQHWGYYPTLREICAETGWDQRAVRRYLERLMAEGYLYFIPGKQRAIVLQEGKIKNDEC